MLLGSTVRADVSPMSLVAAPHTEYRYMEVTFDPTLEDHVKLAPLPDGYNWDMERVNPDHTVTYKVHRAWGRCDTRNLIAIPLITGGSVEVAYLIATLMGGQKAH